MLLVALLLAASPAPRSIAVLEFELQAKGLEIDRVYFSDLVRGAVHKLAPQWRVMTRENMQQMVAAGGHKLEDCQSECEAETGRLLGADLVVTGRISKVGSRLKLSLRMHDTAEAALVSTAVASGASVDALDDATLAAAKELLAPILPVQITNETVKQAPAPALLPAAARWTSLEGGIEGNPSAVVIGPGQIDVFARGVTHALWHRRTSGAGFTPWENLGGVLTTDPVAVSWAAGRVDVFGRGQDNALWHLWYDGSWHPWESMGGQIDGPPSAASWGEGRIDLVARGTDKHAWWLSYDAHKGWAPWKDVEGILTSNVSLVAWGPGRLDLFVRGLDGAAWHNWLDSGAWRGWESLGGQILDDPAAASTQVQWLDVFARGSDGALWDRAFHAAWIDWASLGGQLAGAPVPVVRSGVIEVYVRAANGSLWRRTTAGAWEDLGGTLTSQPAAVAGAVFARGADGALWVFR